MKVTKGLALQDVLRDVHLFTTRVALPPEARIFLLDELSRIEYALFLSCVTR